MTSSRLAHALTAGLLTLMATAGALVGFGVRDGDVARAFVFAGRLLLEPRGIPAAALPALSLVVGVLHHALVAIVWGVVLAVLLGTLRGGKRLLAALVVALIFVALDLWVLPPLLSIGHVTVTSVARAIPMALAIAVALWVTPWASSTQS